MLNSYANFMIHARHVVFVALIFSMGPVLFGWGVKVLYFELRPRRWAKVQGAITNLSIEHQSAGNGLYQQFIPKVEFEYRYNNEGFTNCATFFSSGGYRDASQIIDQYKIGDSVLVLVNPQKPVQSSLESKVTPASCFLIFAGLVLIILDCALLTL